MYNSNLSLLIILFVVLFNNEVNADYKVTFPKGFIFSAATAAYQVEGAWNESGKSESNWDRLVHTHPSFVANKDNGDIACDSYHKYKQDVQLLKDIGFKMYRFSLSWSRILPKGTKEFINPAGINYYNNLINELLANDIEPMVTIYHWDHPQILEDIGGWLNESMVEYFVDYADVAFKHFGDRVKWWITINEPLSIMNSYEGTSGPPALNYQGYGGYLSGHNLLKAHAKAYHLYDQKYRPTQQGKVSFALNGALGISATSMEEDKQAAERFTQFTLGWFAHPVYSSTGDYSPVMREFIDRNSLEEGLPQSRLPVFTAEEVKEIRGTYDYMGFNHYSSNLVISGKVGPFPSLLRDIALIPFFNFSWPASANPTMRVFPEGIRLTVNWLRNQYGNVPVFITENGFSDTGGTNDYNRINYLKENLGNLSLAINEDGINIIGHTVWSILDNFEWASGYKQKFGLVEVDFNHPDRPRTMKESAEFYKKYISEHS
ncbi:hypothetical protein O3M35_000274 [Rhynocoris fuscipes]|uniref:beta-glucosidase n=1 Tax=Rhynocoris fuscipes TaxID=488301 RepID=A0AAW1DKY1_9HEMI